ncbi:hypothetical protein GBAR_LOCUS18519 [Geodia barretti]|uniref:Uncharacterized protein n=1 Tax=Geodia barretti TaxID=519541 RepID=A0AA35SPY8_GEOBA|nr:hypothetical protein GBAR_LOCUS18519 [Geodia barretti]
MSPWKHTTSSTMYIHRMVPTPLNMTTTLSLVCVLDFCSPPCYSKGWYEQILTYKHAWYL